MIDTLCEARKQWKKRDEERRECAPVETVVIPVDTTITVEFVKVEFLEDTGQHLFGRCIIAT